MPETQIVAGQISSKSAPNEGGGKTFEWQNSNARMHQLAEESSYRVQIQVVVAIFVTDTSQIHVELLMNNG